MRTPVTSGNTSVETPLTRRSRASERAAVCGCWLTHASAIGVSASSEVSQAARSRPRWASTSKRPPPLAVNTAPRSAGATRLISSSSRSAMLPGSSVPGSWRAIVRSWVSRRVACANSGSGGTCRAAIVRFTPTPTAPATAASTTHSTACSRKCASVPAPVTPPATVNATTAAAIAAVTARLPIRTPAEKTGAARNGSVGSPC